MIAPADLGTVPERVEFVGGLFPRRHTALLAARAGVGKTWFCVAQATKLSMEGQTVVYFAGEAGTDLFVSRLQSMQDYNPEFIYAYSVIDMLKEGARPWLDETEGARYLQSIAYPHNPDLVVFDSLMSFRAEDESTQRSTNEMMTNVRRIAEGSNTAVLCVHHLRKRGKDDIGRGIITTDQDEIIGSSALVRNASIAYILNGEGATKVLTCVKTWWERPEPKVYELVADKEGFMTMKEQAGVGEAKKARMKEYIHAALKNRAAFTVELTCASHNWNPEEFYRELSEYEYETLRQARGRRTVRIVRRITDVDTRTPLDKDMKSDIM